MGLRVETSFSSFKISPRGYVDSKAYLSEPETLSVRARAVCFPLVMICSFRLFGSPGFKLLLATTDFRAHSRTPCAHPPSFFPVGAEQGVTALESEINVGAATGSVVEGTRGDVLLTSAVEAEWISAFSGNAGAYWAYIGTLSGVFRIYPATVAAKTYDPTLRPWFWRATAFPGQHAVSTPYYDATGAGKVVTISQVRVGGAVAIVRSFLCVFFGGGAGRHSFVVACGVVLRCRLPL